MPELPEVHTIVSDLKKYLVGYCIDKVEITNGYNVIPDNSTLKSAATGSSVKDVQRVAKNIVIGLDNGYYITFHLAMTGRILLRKVSQDKDYHQKVQFTLSKKDKKIALRFCDARMFGKIQVLNTKGLDKLREKYGPDMHTAQITVEVFTEIIRSKNTNIKNALLEQSLVTGLGNIYVTDALWLAGIHPETKTRDISSQRSKALLESAREILSEGIMHRGSTLPDKAYVDIFGKPGQHQNHFRVYGKTKCPKCGTAVEFKKINGRGTYYCPSCQT